MSDHARVRVCACARTQVSDHEWLAGYAELEDVAAKARAMLRGGQAEEIVGRLHVADGAPMSARRFLSLYDARGDDDMFSRHFSVEELKASVGSPLCVCSSWMRAAICLRWCGLRKMRWHATH